MWIMTNVGFVSLVAHRDNMHILIARARAAGQLEALFPENEVEYTPEADYAYRTYIHRIDAADLIGDMIEDIDYPNFKGSVKDGDLHDTYESVWNVMFKYQLRNMPAADAKNHSYQGYSAMLDRRNTKAPVKYAFINGRSTIVPSHSKVGK